MPDNKISLDLGGIESEIAKVKQLEMALAQAEERAKSLAAALNSSSSPSQVGAFGSAITDVMQLRGAVASARQSAQIGGDVRSAALSGANQAAANMAAPTWRNVGNPGAIASNLQSLGIGAGAASQLFDDRGRMAMLSGGGSATAIINSAMAPAMNSLNPFAGQAPQGVVSSLDPMAQSQRLYQQFLQQEQAQQAARLATQRTQLAMAGVVGNAGASAAADFFHYQSQRILTGGDDPMSAAGTYGRLGGAILGGLIGIPFGPEAVIGGAAIGSTVIGAMAEWWAAPEAARQKANIGMAPFLGAYGGPSGLRQWSDYYTGQSLVKDSGEPINFMFNQKGVQTMSRFERMAGWLNGGYSLNGQRHDGLPAELSIGVPDIGATFGQLAGGMFAGGLDPMGPGAQISARYRPFANYGGTTWQQDLTIANDFYNHRRRSGFSLLDGLINHAIGAIKHDIWAGVDERETLAETYTRRLGEIFGKTAPDVAKSISPIFGSLPETGGNTVDIVRRFGPENTLNYLRILNEAHDPGIDPMALSQASAGMRSSERAARIASLQARGSGTAMISAYDRELSIIRGLPDGANSEAFAETSAHRRAAERAAFDQETAISYGVPSARIRGGDGAHAIPAFQSRQQYGL